jgi:hypothetical protein
MLEIHDDHADTRAEQGGDDLWRLRDRNATNRNLDHTVS